MLVEFQAVVHLLFIAVLCGLVGRHQCDGLRLPFLGLVEVPVLRTRRSKRGNRTPRLTAVQLISLGRIFDGPFSIAVLLIGASCAQPSEGIASFCVLWVEPNRFIVIGNGLVVLAFVLPCMTTIVVGVGVIGIERHSLAIIRDGLAVFAFRCPGNTAIIVGMGVFGIKRQGLAVVSNGLVVFSRFLPNIATTIAGFCIAGLSVRAWS